MLRPLSTSGVKADVPLLSFTVSFFPHSIPHCPHS
nr:MAG TPA: hypothetical protein [Caudoviricetes sp.]